MNIEQLESWANQAYYYIRDYHFKAPKLREHLEKGLLYEKPDLDETTDTAGEDLQPGDVVYKVPKGMKLIGQCKDCEFLHEYEGKPSMCHKNGTYPSACYGCIHWEAGYKQPTVRSDSTVNTDGMEEFLESGDMSKMSMCGNEQSVPTVDIHAPPELDIDTQTFTKDELIDAYGNGFRDGKQSCTAGEDLLVYKVPKVDPNTLTLHYEFKPCPFCGGEPVLHISSCEYFLCIGCVSCECWIEHGIEGKLAVEILQDLSDRWNKRA